MKKSVFSLLVFILSAYVSFADNVVRFAYLADTHLGKSANHKAFLACLNDINAQDSLDFVLIGGDITNMGTDRQIESAKKTFDKLNKPYWIVAGNHDATWSESGCNTFIRVFGYEQFEFEAGGYRFLGCNSGPDMRMGPALIPRSSLVWLESLEKDKPVIFLNHYPITYGIANWFDFRRELIRLDCRIAICGHGHRNRSYDYNGLPGVMGRASTLIKERAGYNIVTIRDGVFEMKERSISLEGDARTGKVWYSKELKPVTDTLKYDADGLPEDYKNFKFSQNKEYPQVKVRWSKIEDSNIGSGFVSDGNMGWYATASGKVVGMSLKDGKSAWTVQLGGKIYATPALKDNILVVPCTDGGIYAFNAQTGAQIWKCQTTKGIVASPTIFGKYVYVGDSDGRFRALRLKDGKLLWVYNNVNGFCSGAPYVDKSQVIFTTWGQRVYALDPKNGTLQWVWKRKGSAMFSPGACTPIKSGKRLFVVAPDRRTYCLDTWTGEPLYLADCGRESYVLSEDKSTLYVKSMGGTLHALPTQTRLSDIKGVLADNSPSKGAWMPDVPVFEFERSVWNIESGLGRDITPSALCLSEDVLLVPSDKGVLHAFNRHDGSKLWMHKVGVGPVNPINAWRENGVLCILASSMDGQIKVLEITE